MKNKINIYVYTYKLKTTRNNKKQQKTTINKKSNLKINKNDEQRAGRTLNGRSPRLRRCALIVFCVAWFLCGICDSFECFSSFGLSVYGFWLCLGPGALSVPRRPQNYNRSLGCEIGPGIWCRQRHYPDGPAHPTAPQQKIHQTKLLKRSYTPYGEPRELMGSSTFSNKDWKQ